MRPSASIRVGIAFAAILVGATAVPTRGHAAGITESRTARVTGYAECDHATGQFVVTWYIANDYTTDATVDGVAAAPANTSIADVPRVVPAATTVPTGEHRLPAGEHTGSIAISLTWADGASGTTWWPVYIRAWCPLA